MLQEWNIFKTKIVNKFYIAEKLGTRTYLGDKNCVTMHSFKILEFLNFSMPHSMWTPAPISIFHFRLLHMEKLGT